jgi:hypothetical protein
MSVSKTILVLSVLASPIAIAPARAERVVIGSEGPCIAGPHETGRIRRLPAGPATTARPRNPAEDQFIHCSDATGEEAPADLPNRR